MGKDIVLEIRLFDRLSNNSNFIGNIRIVGILHSHVNMVLIKIYIELKSIRTQKGEF